MPIFNFIRLFFHKILRITNKIVNWFNLLRRIYEENRCSINPVLANAPILHLLKTSENQRCKMGRKIKTNGLMNSKLRDHLCICLKDLLLEVINLLI